MCARYYVPQTEVSSELDNVLMEAENRGKLHSPDFTLKRGEIRPGDHAAVLAMSRLTKTVASFPMQWGFHTEQGLVFNARSETVSTKSLFHESYMFRRCLIPMLAYFEWDHRQKPMLKYRFEPQNLQFACFAGLYRFEGQQPVFTILTRKAASAIAHFHDRMPVILDAHAQSLYLTSPDAAGLALQESIDQLYFGAVCS
ncbi:MAG: SOS response-associated peptidase [Clostridiales bacterium]|nr:SOS response-associated peptidase [Clostridiales bacterium]